MYYVFDKNNICIIVSDETVTPTDSTIVIESNVLYTPSTITIKDREIVEIDKKIEEPPEENLSTVELSQQSEDLLLSIVDLHERLSVLEKERNYGNGN